MQRTDESCDSQDGRLQRLVPVVSARRSRAAAAGASASGVAWRSKRERKQVAKFVPETKVEADRERRRRNRKLKEATFAAKEKNR